MRNDAICPRCEEEPHTIEQWITKCPGTEAASQEIFSTGDLQQRKSSTEHYEFCS